MHRMLDTSATSPFSVSKISQSHPELPVMRKISRKISTTFCHSSGSCCRAALFRDRASSITAKEKIPTMLLQSIHTTLEINLERMSWLSVTGRVCIR